MEVYFFQGTKMILFITFILGYFVMGLAFLGLRFLYHIFVREFSRDNLIKDFSNLYAYAKEIILFNSTKIKIIVVLIAAFIIMQLLPVQIENMIMIDDFLSLIIFSMMVNIFAPKKNSANKKFPVEIFGFIYSIVLMYCSAGDLVIESFSADNFFHEDMWIYGYGVVLTSYLICVATLSRFMERDLSRIEIIFVGMLMMTILEFMTYYGIGFFGGIKFYDPVTFERGILDGVSTIINQGIFIASQSQILERSTSEVLGYIILNGTDVFTVTAVLGYVLQKFMEIESK